MAETTRERIALEQGASALRAFLVGLWRSGSLIPRDEHEAAVTAAYDAGKARAAVLAMQDHATRRKPPHPQAEWDTYYTVGFDSACRHISRAIRADEEPMK